MGSGEAFLPLDSADQPAPAFHRTVHEYTARNDRSRGQQKVVSASHFD
jgi:hypothetical protein